MDDTSRTPDQLIEEIKVLRKKIARLKNSQTKLKKQEIALKEEAIRRRLLIEQSRDGIVVLDTDGAVLEANQKFADMLGYTLQEAQKLHLWDWDKNFSQAVLLELARTVDEKGHHFETKHTRKDGSVCDVELCNNGSVINGKKHIFCICRDVTERKRNDEQLRESQEQLSTFLDNFQGIAYQIARDEISAFRPQLFRGAIERITGYSTEEFCSEKTWNDIIHPDDFANVTDSRKWFVDFPEYIFEAEYRIIRKDGTVWWVKDNAQIVKIGKASLIYGTIFDINERKTVEEAKVKLEEQVRHSQKLEAIGTLAGGVAHDFNNVLGIIIGYTDLVLAEIPENGKTHEKLTHIKKAGNRAKDIIKQLLTFSRKVGPKKQPINVVPVIVEVMTFLRSTLPSTIKLQPNIKADDIMILADPTQMHQVIINLCVNAAQAMENRDGTITVSAENVLFINTMDGPFKTLPGGKYLRIIVQDDGPGISPEIIDRIFDPYFTTRETGKGSGMGLAVVHGIVENHGGVIAVNSILGQGATFTLMIPIIKDTVNEATVQSEIIPTGNESVLFVDDEEDIVDIGRMMLEAQGFHVKTAVNPLDALDYFRKNPAGFDAVVTDMTMPYINGDILYKEIKKIRPDIPIILCTGHSPYIDEELALEMGVAAYIQKPINKQELVCAIRSAIDKQKTTNTCITMPE